MIIVRIWEGLGNQFFQYAYARSLSLRTKEKVCLDLRHENRGDLYGEEYDVSRKRKLELYRIELPAINTEAYQDFRFLKGDSNIRKIQFECAKRGLNKIKYLTDEGDMNQVHSGIFNPKPYSYISGHFFHLDYYENIKELLKKELTLKRQLPISSNLRQLLQRDHTVSVHVRRTDYLTMHFPLCSELYYRQAIKKIAGLVENPVFLFFSDNIQWVKKNISCDYECYYVSEESYRDYEEMEIMRKCRHHILANSTFSYWGAWLGEHENNIVIAPENWLKHLYDKNWILMYQL